MISDIVLKNNMYITYDANNKPISQQYQNNLGELVAYTSDFMLFKSGSDNKYATYDEKFRQIAYQSENNIGVFKSASGSTMNFIKNRTILYTYDKNFKQISYRNV
jgi:hypothetical protein